MSYHRSSRRSERGRSDCSQRKGLGRGGEGSKESGESLRDQDMMEPLLVVTHTTCHTTTRSGRPLRCVHVPTLTLNPVSHVLPPWGMSERGRDHGPHSMIAQTA